jgi:hypothetical protein
MIAVSASKSTKNGFTKRKGRVDQEYHLIIEILSCLLAHKPQHYSTK